MVTKSKNTASSGGRSTTAASSRARRESEPVRVWSEASVTVAVSTDPPQFVKFTHGFEKLSKSGSKVDMERAEREIYDACEEIVNKRVRKLARLIRRLSA